MIIKAEQHRVVDVLARDLEAGMLLVDWHDEHFRGVFGSDPLARSIVELHRTKMLVEVKPEGAHVPYVFSPDAVVGVMEQ